MKPLVSLKRKKPSPEKEIAEVSPGMYHDEYGYGTRLDLNDEELDKLGIKTLPAVGSKFEVHAVAHVIAVRENQHKDRHGGNKSRNLELQVTSMALTKKKPRSGVDAVTAGIEEADEF